MPGFTARIEIDTEDSTPSTARCQHRVVARDAIRIASNREEKGQKARIRLELCILRPLEWRGTASFRRSVSVERPCAIYLGIMDV